MTSNLQLKTSWIQLYKCCTKCISIIVLLPYQNNQIFKWHLKLKDYEMLSKTTAAWLWENWVTNTKNTSLKSWFFVETSSKLSNSTVDFKLVIVPAGSQATEIYDNKSMDLWLPPTATDCSATTGCNQKKNIKKEMRREKRKEQKGKLLINYLISLIQRLW